MEENPSQFFSHFFAITQETEWPSKVLHRIYLKHYKQAKKKKRT